MSPSPGKPQHPARPVPRWLVESGLGGRPGTQEGRSEGGSSLSYLGIPSSSLSWPVSEHSLQARGAPVNARPALSEGFPSLAGVVQELLLTTQSTEIAALRQNHPIRGSREGQTPLPTGNTDGLCNCLRRLIPTRCCQSLQPVPSPKTER